MRRWSFSKLGVIGAAESGTHRALQGEWPCSGVTSGGVRLSEAGTGWARRGEGRCGVVCGKVKVGWFGVRQGEVRWDEAR